MCTVLHAGVIQGGIDFPEVVEVVNDAEMVQVAKVGQLKAVTKVYFRECDLNKHNNYKKHIPYHQDTSGTILTAQSPFPRQCGAELGSANLTKLTSLPKTNHMMVEVFATADNTNWFRVGIVHLRCYDNEFVELNILCMDTITQGGKSVAGKALDFVKLFARGQAPEQSTVEEDTLYKYAGETAYGTPARQRAWGLAGACLVLDATTLRSMTVYMHAGFVFAAHEAARLFDDTRVGTPEKERRTKVAAHHTQLRAYFEHCCSVVQPNHDENTPSPTISNPLWKAMCALHQFKDHEGVIAVQKAFPAGTKYIDDELSPEKVNGTPKNRFAYATLALLVSLALLYCNPRQFMDDNADDAAVRAQAEDMAITLNELCTRVHHFVASGDAVDRTLTSLADEMLLKAQDVKQNIVIPMVFMN